MNNNPNKQDQSQNMSDLNLKLFEYAHDEQGVLRSQVKELRQEVKDYKEALFRLPLSLLVLGFLFSGCASFPGNELPVYTLTDLPPAASPEKSVCLLSVPDKGCDEECQENFKPIMEMFEKSGYFQKAPEHCTPGSNEKGFSINFTNETDYKFGNIALAVISGFICGATYGIVPAYERTDFTVKAQLKKNDNLLKEYVYREHVDTWIHPLMLIKMRDYSPNATAKEITKRVYMNFLHDYSLDVQQGKIPL